MGSSVQQQENRQWNQEWIPWTICWNGFRGYSNISTALPKWKQISPQWVCNNVNESKIYNANHNNIIFIFFVNSPLHFQAIQEFVKAVDCTRGVDENNGDTAEEGGSRSQPRQCRSKISAAIAVKFLLARKFDVARAVVLYEQHEESRRDGLYDFDPRSEKLKRELETGKFTILVSSWFPIHNIFGLIRLFTDSSRNEMSQAPPLHFSRPIGICHWLSTIRLHCRALYSSWTLRLNTSRRRRLVWSSYTIWVAQSTPTLTMNCPRKFWPYWR